MTSAAPRESINCELVFRFEFRHRHPAPSMRARVTLSIDVFWSFRSPYSYLATPRLVDMAQAYDLAVNVRPVYPLAMRSGAFFSQVNPLWVPYLMRDTVRLAEMLGLSYRWPRPDPVVIDPVTRAGVPNQPYIHRLTRLGCAAADAGHGLPFLKE